MSPAPNPYVTRVFGAPPGMEADVHPLEVCEGADNEGHRVLASCWEIDEHEKTALQAGDGVWVTLWTDQPLPVAVSVGKTPEAGLRVGALKTIRSQDADGHAVFSLQMSLSFRERSDLADGERLWVLIRSEGLPPLCAEVARLPYYLA